MRHILHTTIYSLLRTLSARTIEVPVEVLFVGEVRFLEIGSSSCDNGLAILARQARRRFCVSTCPHQSTVAAVPVSGHSGAARLYALQFMMLRCYPHRTPLCLPRHARVRERPWVFLGLGSRFLGLGPFPGPVPCLPWALPCHTPVSLSLLQQMSEGGGGLISAVISG